MLSFIAFFVIISSSSSSVTGQRRKKKQKKNKQKRHDEAISGQSTKNGKSTDKIAQQAISNNFQQVLQKEFVWCLFLNSWDYSFSFSRSSLCSLHEQHIRRKWIKVSFSYICLDSFYLTCSLTWHSGKQMNFETLSPHQIWCGCLWNAPLLSSNLHGKCWFVHPVRPLWCAREVKHLLFVALPVTRDSSPVIQAQCPACMAGCPEFQALRALQFYIHSWSLKRHI